MDFDILGAVGLFLVSIPCLSYYRILCVSYANLQSNSTTLRIQTLSTRTAIFLPVYSVIIWLSLVVPVLYVPLEVPTALAEGFCFYCFFTMVVANLGGPCETVILMEARKPSCCSCCCPSTPVLFFKRVQAALFHVMWTRTAVVLASAICTLVAHSSQTYRNPAFLASLILTVLSLALLVNGFGSLILFYQMIMEESSNLLGTSKIVLLKISVGLIVIQGLIEEFLYAFGVITVESSSTFSGKERAQRFYCFIVLVEYSLLSAAVYYAYAAEIKPNERHSKARVTSIGGDGGDEARKAEGQFLPNLATDTIQVSTDSALRPQLTFYEYVCGVFAFADVFYSAPYAADIERPLLTA